MIFVLNGVSSGNLSNFRYFRTEKCHVYFMQTDRLNKLKACVNNNNNKNGNLFHTHKGQFHLSFKNSVHLLYFVLFLYSNLIFQFEMGGGQYAKKCFSLAQG